MSTSIDAPIYEAAFAKAIAHPVRLQALAILNERTASPSEIARELDLPVANVSYHVTRLLALKMIEEVETRHVRGAVEHRYRAMVRLAFEQGEWNELTDKQKHQVGLEAVRVIAADLLGASGAGDFLRKPDDGMEELHLHISALSLDVEGWNHVSQGIRRVYEEAFALQAAANARREAGAETSRPVTAHLVMALYERDRLGLLPGGPSPGDDA